jgi:DnaJ family protein C protein 8
MATPSESWQVEAANLKSQGDAAFASKEYETAINHYTSAISLDDNNHVLFSNRCACHQALSNKSKALKDAEKIVELKPDWAKGWGRLGVARFALTRYEGAVEAYGKGLKLDAANKVCLEGLDLSKVALVKQTQEGKEKRAREEEEKAAKKAAEEAAAAEAAAAAPSEDDLLGDFFGEVDSITTAAPVKSQKEVQGQAKYTDQDLGTSEEQIGRLMAKNHLWKNLNPFTVLQLDTDANLEDIKTRYRKLSTLTHPDKNLGVADATQAFDYVKEAYNTLKDEEKAKHVADLVEAGRDRAREAHKVAAKGEGAVESVEEMEKKEVMKLFAEIEMKRRDIEARKQNQKKREREQEDEEQDKLRKGMNFEKDWNEKERMENRVGGWRDFGKGGKKAKPN